MLHEFADYLRRQIDDELSILESDLAGGCAKDHADYKRICGQYSALKAFREVIRESLVRFINDEEGDDE